MSEESFEEWVSVLPLRMPPSELPDVLRDEDSPEYQRILRELMAEHVDHVEMAEIEAFKTVSVETRKVLEVAGVQADKNYILDGRFHPLVVKRALKSSSREVRIALQEALAAGIIYQRDHWYYFTNSLLPKAIVSRLEDEDVSALNQSIGTIEVKLLSLFVGLKMRNLEIVRERWEEVGDG